MSNQDHIPPKLRNLKKELPFKVPRGYFDDFPARMEQRLHQEQQITSKKQETRFIDFIKPALSLAAAFAAIFILVYVPVKTLNTRQVAESTEFSIDNALSIDFYNIFEDIDEHTFYSLLDDDYVDDIHEPESLVAFLAANYSDYDVFIESQK